VLRHHGYVASALRGVPVYAAAFASTHCTYPQKNEKCGTNTAELASPETLKMWQWKLRAEKGGTNPVTHASTNRVLRIE